MKRFYAIIIALVLTFSLLSACDSDSVRTDADDLTLEEKIYGLSLIWKEAEYNFVFWDMLDGLDWDSAYNEALERVINTKDTREYYLELMRFTALLRDGHTDVWFPTELFEQYGELPFASRYIDGKHIILNTDADLEHALYSEILEINGTPIQQYIEEEVFPYIWHEKFDSVYDFTFMMIPIIEDGNEIELTTDNGVYRVKPTIDDIDWVRSFSFEYTEEVTQIHASDTLIVSITDDNIAVITIPTFSNDDLPNQFYGILPQIEDCKGFLIDVRWNGGGNSSNADAVAQAFIDGEFQNSRSRMPIHNGTHKAWRRNYRTFEDSIDTVHIQRCPLFINAPVVVLANERSASAAEDFLVALDNIDRITIVGAASYGSTGQPLFGVLPGGGTYRICTRWCLYPNGKEFINVGVEPHIYADFDYINWYDGAFDTAITALREQTD